MQQELASLKFYAENIILVFTYEMYYSALQCFVIPF